MAYKLNPITGELDYYETSEGGSLAIGDSIGSATAGSIFFAGASGVLAQDNANFFIDDLNNRLGLGTNSPTARLHILSAAGTSAIKVVDSGGTVKLQIDDEGSTIFKNIGSGFGDQTEFISTLSNANVKIHAPTANMYSQLEMAVAFYSGGYRLTSGGNFETRASQNVDFFVIGTSKYSARLAGAGLWLGDNATPVDPTARLDIGGDILRLRNSKTPASASASGNQGSMAWDTDYLYVCTATNTWKRAALTTW